jgi:hypothetical protein
MQHTENHFCLWCSYLYLDMWGAGFQATRIRELKDGVDFQLFDVGGGLGIAVI